MRLLITNDLHQMGQKWALLTKAATLHTPDWVFITGDLLPKPMHGQDMYGQQVHFFRAMRRYLAEMKRAGVREVFLYFGNDDLHVLEPKLDALEADGLCRNMNQRVVEVGGYAIAGMSYVRDYPFAYKFWCAPDGEFSVCPQQFGPALTMTDDGYLEPIPDLASYLAAKPSLAARLAELTAQIVPAKLPMSIWMIHQPPDQLGMDICGHGARVGSPAVREFIEQHQPLLTMHGHIHESPLQPGGQWKAQVGRTTVLQPGQVGEHLHYVTCEARDGVVTNLEWHT